MITGYSMWMYGKDYAAYSLRALAPYVEKHVIVYTDKPSFGSSTTLPCPDSRDEMYAIAQRELGDKLVWVEGEPQNYETVKRIAPETQVILEADADEVWPVSLIARVLRLWRNDELTHDRYRMPMIHHWRSFGYVCRDQLWPVRLGLFNRKVHDPIPWLYDGAPILHFGYARSLSDMQYKIDTSAHKHEWRAGWWDDVFLRFPERLTDLHPVVNGLWNAEPYDKRQLPAALRDHPYYRLEVIA